MGEEAGEENSAPSSLTSTASCDLRWALPRGNPRKEPAQAFVPNNLTFPEWSLGLSREQHQGTRTERGSYTLPHPQNGGQWRATSGRSF